MLVLTRLLGEEILIGHDIVIRVCEFRGGGDGGEIKKVRIGITAPTSIAVHRREVFEEIRAEAAADALGAVPAPAKAGGGRP